MFWCSSSWEVQDLPEPKPCCLGLIFWCVSRNWWVANIFYKFFIECDVRATGRLFLDRFLEPPLYICVIMARFRSVGILLVLREALYSSWRGWARLLLHSLRSIAGKSLEPPEEFCEIVFITIMMSSLVMLISAW